LIIPHLKGAIHAFIFLMANALVEIGVWIFEAAPESIGTPLISASFSEDALLISADSICITCQVSKQPVADFGVVTIVSAI